MSQEVVFGIRPESVQDAITVADAAHGTTLEIKVEVSGPMGPETLLCLDSGVFNDNLISTPTF